MLVDLTEQMREGREVMIPIAMPARVFRYPKNASRKQRKKHHELIAFMFDIPLSEAKAHCEKASEPGQETRLYWLHHPEAGK